MSVIKPKRICVLVLGDVGRSPRMQYHAHSLAQQYQCTVELVGHTGTPCFPMVQNNEYIKQTLFTPYTKTLNHFNNKILLYIALACKALIQMIQLLYILLFQIQCPDIILVQTPPAIPTLLVVYIVSNIGNCTVIVDWHNLAYTLLQNKYAHNDTAKQQQSMIVRCSEIYERHFGYLLNHSTAICVTNAMRLYLKQWSGIDAVTLHDCPPAHFHQLSIEEQHRLWMKLEADQMLPADELYQWCNFTRTTHNSLMTEVCSDDSIVKRTERPAVIISSTSWTPDEDFNVLLDALLQYDKLTQSTNTVLPRLLCIITGKGPLKDTFIHTMKQYEWTNVRIVTMFVAASDYPLILGSADIGVSLHQSSSGLDLPMKVVDMYGCSLPVCSIRFPCIDELVQDGRTGLLFDNAAELAAHLQTLLQQFPIHTHQLTSMRHNIGDKYVTGHRWSSNWNAVMVPVVQQALQQQIANRARRQQQLVAALAMCIVCCATYFYT